ncbi:TraB/GumN family protein [Chitinophaga sp. Cy-1792]|uniref:TraB/GumN family protein n=1 Tax=Chitinophaga sp. Cy-1792 TaxID=2608339 RepID=UPI0014217F3C|nr:TraB/GumN family protein [Chitinophaga sp. Cy-1792]NIG57148.1 TraB/GumN family protein [Chitinophaga sp. Cy-1792]
MKKVCLTILAIATIILVISIKKSAAQTKNSAAVLANSMLWKISGNGLQQPSYLYGTYHMVCANDFIIKDKVRQALEGSNTYVIEADVIHEEELKKLQPMMFSDTAQSKRLPAKTYTEVDSILKKVIGVGFDKVDNLTLSTISSIMMQAIYTCQEKKRYEEELFKLATAKQIPMDTLESIEGQMVFYKKAFSDEVTLDQIRNFDQYKGILQSSVKQYNNEELLALHSVNTDPKYMTKETQYWLLQVRNANWVKKMPAMMKKGSNFFAVGAAHLAGNDGLIRLLQAQGYKVEPVLN